MFDKNLYFVILILDIISSFNPLLPDDASPSEFRMMPNEVSFGHHQIDTMVYDDTV